MPSRGDRPDQPPSQQPPKVLIASNRGPVSFSVSDHGELELHRGGGGLVSGLGSLHRPDVLWVCAALGEGDRQAAREAPHGRLDLAGHDTQGTRVRMLDMPPTTFRRAYNSIANSTLWFVHHLMYDTPTTPRFGPVFRRDWQAYLDYNEAFAAALAEDAAEGGKVLVQDYHLTIAPALLREKRTDLKIAHFSHTPWAPPDYFRVLPDDVGRQVLLGVLGADHAGFLTARWARAFMDCCREVLGAEVDAEALTVTHDGRTTQLGVHPLGIDAEGLSARAHERDVEARVRSLRRAAGDLRIVLRVDRTELSKNIVRGLESYRELLRTHPEWRGRIVHLAFAYPSRHDLPEYRAYTGAVQRVAREIDDEFATPDWSPVALHIEDDYPRTLAAYRLADVLLVNPIRDGMNLVAKEGPVLSERGVVLVLSKEAGAVHELGGDAILVNPYDISQTAEALHAALLMGEDERSARTRRLAAAATACPPTVWLRRQLDALD
jgi:trehalose 6-phosphate synthase